MNLTLLRDQRRMVVTTPGSPPSPTILYSGNKTQAAKPACFVACAHRPTQQKKREKGKHRWQAEENTIRPEIGHCFPKPAVIRREPSAREKENPILVEIAPNHVEQQHNNDGVSLPPALGSAPQAALSLSVEAHPSPREVQATTGGHRKSAHIS